MSQKTQTDITIATAATELLDAVIRELKDIGLKDVSRNELSRIITMTILERYNKLPENARQQAPRAWLESLKQSQYGVKFTPNMDVDLGKLIESAIAHEYFVTSRPEVLLIGARRLLTDLKERKQKEYDIFGIKLEDIKRHLDD